MSQRPSSLVSDLSDRLGTEPYEAYTYSYPHKTAYRPLDPRPLTDVWVHEDRSALFVYLHVPFCEMRCGFCNLFTYARPDPALTDAYLSALGRQVDAAAEALPDARFARLALGGGTPTILGPGELDALFTLLHERLGIDPTAIPAFAEVSPETVSVEKLTTLRRHGVDRASIGVQSFVEREARGARRPQANTTVHRALGQIRDAGFPVLNIDLIYGLAGQTPQSWLDSIDAALEYEPEELYLYPLYVRPLTGLGNSQKNWADQRLQLYRIGRDRLLERGYEQSSMRMFRRAGAAEIGGPPYRCQSDGMLGLGPGARSYTERLHFSTEYAVGRRGVSAILHDWVQRPREDFSVVDYGFELDDDERRRRFVILSLLSEEGASVAAYRDAFGAELAEDFPELPALCELALCALDGRSFKLTPAGLELSDAVGPALYSPAVRRRMQEYDPR